MNSPNLPNVMFLSDDQKHQTIEKLEAIHNLLYLIRMEASNPAQVTSYADLADRTLRELQFQMLPESMPNDGKNVFGAEPNSHS